MQDACSFEAQLTQNPCFRVSHGPSQPMGWGYDLGGSNAAGSVPRAYACCSISVLAICLVLAKYVTRNKREEGFILTHSRPEVTVAGAGDASHTASVARKQRD